MFDPLIDTTVSLVLIRIYHEVLAHDESRQRLNSTISDVNQKVVHLHQVHRHPPLLWYYQA